MIDENMSVSDDSKMKLIETKYSIHYSICKQIKIKEFQKWISLNELKFENKSIYDLIDKYDKNSLKSDFNVEEVHKQLVQTIRTKCINILQLISGQDINSEDMTDSEIQQKLETKLNELSLELSETQRLGKCLDKNFQNYLNLFNKYLESVEKYYKKYKIPFKLSYDEMVCTLEMSKAQALCIRNRLTETDSVLETYGNKETIERLREERNGLEVEEFQLKNDLKKAQQLLSEYESLDKDLLKEYKRLKSDLECRQWAINELNKSSGSTSNGSFISD